ncbi:MAG: DUF4058 family protein [Armatimonadota bacterium]|nr:DUF4058 family protein [Armatimonadota bacterium]MCX7777765.1 DUF4058 family protein [Armatimonadota bacterium]MDW8025422.1 DUF4058 family protein [Armatimonadota bacterium]
MPSPFPGMDPYLENPVLWPGVHQGLISSIRAALNAILPPHYVADIGERVYIVQPERSIYPDLVVFEHPSPQIQVEQARSTKTAVATVYDPPFVLTYEPVEIREVFVEILPVGEESKVVTIIEVLSYTNKTEGHEGRKLYLTKQQEILKSQTHLIEIDLLRTGEHTVAVSKKELLKRCRWDYLVSLHRGGQGNRFEVWAITVRQRLPRILVPLADGDPDVVLDLQAVFDRCYDEGAYVRRIDYRREPAVALQGEDAEWADKLLREKGLRI